MTTKTTRTTKTNVLSGGVAILPVVVLIVAAASFSANAAPDKKPVPHAVIAGTVFRDPGFALPGATVVLMRKGQAKPKKLEEAVSNYRGEFAFEVPAVEGAYIVRASLKGFHPEEKEALISADERIEVTLVLVPESKK
jgi:Carboxypeptidase regulatory-like domain